MDIVEKFWRKWIENNNNCNTNKIPHIIRSIKNAIEIDKSTTKTQYIPKDYFLRSVLNGYFEDLHHVSAIIELQKTKEELNARPRKNKPNTRHVKRVVGKVPRSKIRSTLNKPKTNRRQHN